MQACLRAAVAATFLACGLFLGHQAVAHSWYSSSGCCGGMDCTALEAGDLRYTLDDDGTPAWLVVETGEMIPADETRASPDRMNHRCIYLGGGLAGMTRKATLDGEKVWCLWISEGSF